MFARSVSFCVDDVWYAFHPTLRESVIDENWTNATILEGFRKAGYLFNRKAGDIILVDDPARPELNLTIDEDP